MPITSEGFIERETEFLLGDTLQLILFNGVWTADIDATMASTIADEEVRYTVTPGNVTITFNGTTDELEHTIIETFTTTTGHTYNRYGLIKGSSVANDSNAAVTVTTFDSATQATLDNTPASYGLAVTDRVVENGTYHTIDSISTNQITVSPAFSVSSGSGTIYNATGTLLFVKELTPAQTAPIGGDINLNHGGSSTSTC